MVRAGESMNRRQENILTELCREAMLERDNHTCQAIPYQIGIQNSFKECRGHLEMHHIHSKSKIKKLKWDLDNLITFCNRHHYWWWHKYSAIAVHWFEKHFPGRAEYLLGRVMTIEKIYYNNTFFEETKRRLSQ